METILENGLDLERIELLSQYSEEELQLFQSILEESSSLTNNPISIVEIRSEVGTDG